MRSRLYVFLIVLEKNFSTLIVSFTNFQVLKFCAENNSILIFKKIRKFNFNLKNKRI